ncbi:antibiotic biosynthesis monooxygenase family protein [Neogemmobacter tilapiae]|uniref:ABM domain-containing protein n=1 Tax=Neogemmobacter tilapiae TaxID=875041 RepID=A0A918TIW9_9RHOB|nr:antibiotic biosynthesis monooxygenase family protein [Gemmobacter tilapiae]GHC47854.1 hypothetical protein GCM10007315_07190 [Gemmobacter tilapiae]
MIVEYLRYAIPPEQVAAFVQDYDKAGQVLRQSPFALGFEISQCVDDPSQFILRIEWTSKQDHLEGFRGSAIFRELLGHIRPYIPMIQEMRHYQPLPGNQEAYARPAYPLAPSPPLA